MHCDGVSATQGALRLYKDEVESGIAMGRK